jgi:phospholipase/carboxylesterase
MYIKEPAEKAQAIVIWLHGLGSNYQDMAALSDALSVKESVKHIYLQAPDRAVTINGGMRMPAWYDIQNITLNSREDLQGLLESQNTLEAVIDQEIQQGLSSEKIYLAGFSQGAAVALFTGIACEQRLGGVICLSGYLPCVEHLKINQQHTLPIFFGVGLYDDVVLPQWTQIGFQFLKQHQYRELILQEYNMAHAVCSEEVQDLSKWLSERIQINIQRDLMSAEGDL